MRELFISVWLPEHANWLGLGEQLVEADVVYARSSWSRPVFLTCAPYKASALHPLSSVLLAPGFLISDTGGLRKHTGEKLVVKQWYIKAVKPCKFKTKGINLTLLKVTHHSLILNVNSMQIHSPPSQRYRCWDLGTEQLQIYLCFGAVFFFGASLDFPWTVQRAVSLLPTLTRLILWRAGETCQSLIRSLHLRDLAAPHLEQSVSLLGCCFEVRPVGLRQDELIVTVGTELIMQSLGASCVRGVFFSPTASLCEIKILIFKVGNPNHRELKSLPWLGASVYLPSATTPSDCGRKARDYQRHTTQRRGHVQSSRCEAWLYKVITWGTWWACRFLAVSAEESEYSSRNLNF